MKRDYRDDVVEILAASEARLRAQVVEYVEVIADLALENIILKGLYQKEFIERVHGDAQLRLERWRRVDRQKGSK